MRGDKGVHRNLELQLAKNDNELWFYFAPLDFIVPDICGWKFSSQQCRLDFSLFQKIFIIVPQTFALSGPDKPACSPSHYGSETGDAHTHTHIRWHYLKPSGGWKLFANSEGPSALSLSGDCNRWSSGEVPPSCWGLWWAWCPTSGTWNQKEKWALKRLRESFVKRAAWSSSKPPNRLYVDLPLSADESTFVCLCAARCL